MKRRKIRQSDWQKVQEFLKKELDRRKSCQFRKRHEPIWKEVDRQIAMEAVQKIVPRGADPMDYSWQSAFELGELSKASEVITADVMRMIFPASRTWLEAHCKAPSTVDPKTGAKAAVVSAKQQQMADGIQRAFMTQQHADFGLKASVELSVKEALHHGGFVATVEWKEQNKIYDGQGVESLSAPVWVPHSLWNCYPDPSPSIVPGAIFYPGSMMIVSYMPRYKVLALKGDGYMNIDAKKIPKRKNANKDVDTEDVELVTYYGDLNMERDDGDIFLPNSKCITANGTIIFYAPNPLPFPEVIYQGYERQDVRDPYFTSPIIKNSPMHKMTTILANQFIDAVKLHTIPPGTYDGNDPSLVLQGGPKTWPGAMSASKGSGKVTFMPIGDPNATLLGVQFGMRKLEEGTSVNAVRSGAGASDRKTATEVQNTQAGSEIRTVDFVGKMEQGGLRPFLYMQHELNLKNLQSYSFYCPEKGLPDFIEVKKDDLPKVVHFEIVGSKGVLGEQRRSQQMTAVTAFASGNPLFAPLLNAPDILIDMYEDAGVKGAEKYVKTEQNKLPPEVAQKMQQAGQMIQELQTQLKDAQSGAQIKAAELQQKAQEAQAQLVADMKLAAMEADATARQAQIDAANERFLALLKAQTEIEKAEISAGTTLQAAQINAAQKGVNGAAA